MSEQVQVQTHKPTSIPQGAARAVQLPEPENEVPRLEIGAQMDSAARFGHSLGAVGVESASAPLIQRQVKPEDEEGAVQRKVKPEEDEETLQRKEASEEEDKDALQMLREEPQVGPEGGRVPPGVESAIQLARGGGQPLEAGVQAQMGEALGHDFSRVRVHADAGADTLNRQIQAKAFTTGQDVFFKQNTYNPVSSAGLELLRHELSHVKQQSTGQVSGNSNGMTVRPAGDAFEREANARVGQEPKDENHQLQGISGVQRYTIQREISLNEWKWDSFNLIFSRSDELKLIDKAIENYENAVKNKKLKSNVDFVSMLEKILFAIENWEREKSKKGRVSKRQNSVKKLKKKVIEEIGKHPLPLDLESEQRQPLPLSTVATQPPSGELSQVFGAENFRLKHRPPASPVAIQAPSQLTQKFSQKNMGLTPPPLAPTVATQDPTDQTCGLRCVVMALDAKGKIPTSGNPANKYENALNHVLTQLQAIYQTPIINHIASSGRSQNVQQIARQGGKLTSYATIGRELQELLKVNGITSDFADPMDYWNKLHSATPRSPVIVLSKGHWTLCEGPVGPPVPHSGGQTKQFLRIKDPLKAKPNENTSYVLSGGTFYYENNNGAGPIDDILSIQ